MSQLKPRVDRIGLVLVVLGLFFIFFSLIIEILSFPKGSLWGRVSLGLGSLLALMFAFINTVDTTAWRTNKIAKFSRPENLWFNS